MTPVERANLAEQLQGNALWHDILAEIENGAIEALIYAKDEQARVEAQWRVRAARAFRADCQAALDNNRPRKGAPA